MPKADNRVNIYLDPAGPITASVLYWKENASLPFWMPRGKRIKLKHNGNYFEYEQVYAGFDIETTNITRGEDHLAFMYHWQFVIAGEASGFVIMGRTWAEFIDFMQAVNEFYELSVDHRIIVWIANAGFEFQFIRKLFEWDPDDFFAREERHPLKFRSGGFEFHEALTDEFKTYQQQIVKNAATLADALKKNGVLVFPTPCIMPSVIIVTP